jgi:hypothetical protein
MAAWAVWVAERWLRGLRGYLNGWDVQAGAQWSMEWNLNENRHVVSWARCVSWALDE